SAWSREMVQTFGERIRPELRKIWKAAKAQVREWERSEPTKTTVRRVTGQTDESPTVVTTERQQLRRRLAAEARGARRASAEARRAEAARARERLAQVRLRFRAMMQERRAKARAEKAEAVADARARAKAREAAIEALRSELT